MPEKQNPEDDIVQPFVLERSSLRGAFVRLGPAIDAILNRHDTPPSVKKLLGQFLGLGPVLAARLKFEGIFTLQARGNGPAPLFVADFTSTGALRGYASVTGDMPALDLIHQAPLPKLIGEGYLAMTVDQYASKERYQGIVELTGAFLKDSILHYFDQSEQIPSALMLACDQDEQGKWRSAALLLQRLPEIAQSSTLLNLDDDEQEHWNRGKILLETATVRELLDPSLAAKDLLYRLFHEEGLRIFPTTKVYDSCRCSREGIKGTLKTLPREELSEAFEGDTLLITCDFCSRDYQFTKKELSQSLINS